MSKTTINQLNLKGPRFRPTRTVTLGRDFLRRFKAKYPQYKSMHNEEIKAAVVRFHEVLSEKVILFRDGVELPEELGYIFIGTCMSPKKENVDFAASKKLNSRVKYRNFESDNYLAKIFYTNYSNKYRLVDREIWGFKAARKFTRLVGKTYPQEWKKYVQVENYRIINTIFKKRSVRDYYRAKTEVFTEDYNEFNFD